MKALIIILALVGLTFVGLLVYGGSKSQEPKKACERIPSDPKDGDAWKNWCPPGIAESTRGLQARFGPGLGQGTQTLEVGKAATSFGVNAKPGTKARTAKLAIKSGNFVLATSTDGDAVLCLCEPGTPIPPTPRAQCDARWQKKNAGATVCQAGFERGTMPFGQFGGRIDFPATGVPATIEVK